MERKKLANKVVAPKLHEKFRLLMDRIFPDDESEAEIAQSSQDTAALSSLSGLNLIIEYEDSKGKRTQRVISCRQYLQADHKDYLKAFCHHRSAMRSFRLDRIVDVYDPLTGESLSPVEAFFAQFAPDRTQSSGLTWGLSVSRRADLVALINALVFLARSDQEYHPSERMVLERAVTSFWLRLEILSDLDCEPILEFADKVSPDSELFWVALHQLKTDPQLVEIFRRSGQQLIEVDGVVKDIEAYWAMEFEDFFRS